MRQRLSTPSKDLTARDLKLAQRLANEMAKLDPDEYSNETRLRLAAKRAGIKGKMDAGCYRAALVTPKLVFKVTHGDDDDSTLQKEARYIQKMLKGKNARHFPATVYLKTPKRRAELLVQRRVKMTGRDLYENLQDEVEDLAERLGVDDVHEGNYGWAGRKGREYPVFIDVDLRVSRKRGRTPRRRSWTL